jgi:hypothetical protein
MSKVIEMLDEIIADGIMTSAEHEALMEEIHADGKIDEVERAQISRIFKLIQEGKLKIVDEEREKHEARRRDELKKKLGIS